MTSDFSGPLVPWSAYWRTEVNKRGAARETEDEWTRGVLIEKLRLLRVFVMAAPGLMTGLDVFDVEVYWFRPFLELAKYLEVCAAWPDEGWALGAAEAYEAAQKPQVAPASSPQGVMPEIGEEANGR